MKNVYVCIPCLMLGGSEIAALQMVKALTQDDYNITVLCYYEYDSKMVERYSELGVEICLLHLERNGVLGLIKLFFCLYKLFIKGKPNIVHVQYFAPGMIPILAAKIAGIEKIFATIHAAGKNGYGLKSKLIFKFSTLLTDHFFCVSQNTEKFWFGKVGSHKKSKHSTIYNGVDIGRYSEIKKKKLPNLSNDDFVVGIVGRIVKPKGHDCLFKAISLLEKEHDNLKVLIIGNGGYKRQLEKIAGDLNIEEKIVWCGSIEPEQLPGYYKCMDIFVMPSHYEGFGLTAVEAMAAGCPVIATGVPGLIEVLGSDGTCGCLFNVDDSLQLAKHLGKLMGNIELRKTITDNAKQRIERLFDIDRQNKAWQKAYSILER